LPSETVAIVGTGLIGASIGLRARARGSRVVGWDADPNAAAQALAAGALDVVASDEAAAVAEADVVVLAAPLEPTLASLERFRAHPPRAALIIDVASVKVPVHAAGAGLAAFVATHPIAGSERSGPGAARTDLFEGRAWTYDPLAAPDATERACAFVIAMGARPIPIPSALHDRVTALTSHLPQLLAVALAGQLAARLGDDGVLELCGTGIRSMTRLGASSWAMWEGVLSANAPAVAQEVRELSTVLSEIADELDAARTHSLQSHFAKAAAVVGSLSQNETTPNGV
jgi:prephenate dehydrogenase